MSLYHHEDLSKYKRTLDPIDVYISRGTIVVAKDLGISEEEAEEEVRYQVTQGEAQPVYPQTKILYRPAIRADREVKIVSFDKILDFVKQKDRVLSPNLVVLENSDTYRAYEGEMIDTNLARRKKLKKKQHDAGMRGDNALKTFYKNAQVVRKTLNNSISGARGTPYNPHANASSHPLLTSTCRVLTSTSNATTERFVAGNRHYYNFDITIEALALNIGGANLKLIEEAMDFYDLIYPTPEYTLSRIKECCTLYWDSPLYWKKIEKFVRSLTNVELAAIMFVADFRSFREINPKFARELFEELMLFSNNNDSGVYKRPEKIVDLNGAKDQLSDCDDYINSYSTQLTAQELDGMGKTDAFTKNPEAIISLAENLRCVTNKVKGYYNLWTRAFMITNVMPHSIFMFPTSLRQAVPGSDTDSTLFTMQLQVEWYYNGACQFGHEANCVRELSTYLNSQLVCHYLAMLSKQMGARDRDMFRLKMKPEFSYEAMAFTLRMKHYFFKETGCEGEIYKLSKIDYGTKGVALKSSKLDKWIINASDAFIRCVMDKATCPSGTKFTFEEVISPVAYLEHYLLEQMKKGKGDFYYNVKIKDPGSYKAGSDNPIFFNQTLWDEGFGEKYQKMGEYPIECKKVNVDLDKKAKVAEWLEGMPKHMALPLKGAMDEKGRDTLTNILVPTDFLAENSIPEEIISAVDLHNILNTLIDSYYYVLETCGVYIRNKKLSTYAYMYMTKEQAEQLLPFNIKEYIPDFEHRD